MNSSLPCTQWFYQVWTRSIYNEEDEFSSSKLKFVVQVTEGDRYKISIYKDKARRSSQAPKHQVSHPKMHHLRWKSHILKPLWEIIAFKLYSGNVYPVARGTLPMTAWPQMSWQHSAIPTDNNIATTSDPKMSTTWTHFTICIYVRRLRQIGMILSIWLIEPWYMCACYIGWSYLECAEHHMRWTIACFVRVNRIPLTITVKRPLTGRRRWCPLRTKVSAFVEIFKRGSEDSWAQMKSAPGLTAFFVPKKVTCIFPQPKSVPSSCRLSFIQ